jgi:hypothetical protein
MLLHIIRRCNVEKHLYPEICQDLPAGALLHPFELLPQPHTLVKDLLNWFMVLAHFAALSESDSDNTAIALFVLLTLYKPNHFLYDHLKHTRCAIVIPRNKLWCRSH